MIIKRLKLYFIVSIPLMPKKNETLTILLYQSKDWFIK